MARNLPAGEKIKKIKKNKRKEKKNKGKNEKMQENDGKALK